jgi:hypothetical protein
MTQDQTTQAIFLTLMLAAAFMFVYTILYCESRREATGCPYRQTLEAIR